MSLSEYSDIAIFCTGVLAGVLWAAFIECTSWVIDYLKKKKNGQ